jgi:hypothetical protein
VHCPSRGALPAHLLRDERQELVEHRGDLLARVVAPAVLGDVEEDVDDVARAVLRAPLRPELAAERAPQRAPGEREVRGLEQARRAAARARARAEVEQAREHVRPAARDARLEPREEDERVVERDEARARRLRERVAQEEPAAVGAQRAARGGHAGGRAGAHSPLEEAVPGALDEPVLGARADGDAADDALERGVHLLGGLARIRERVEVGAEGLELLVVRGLLDVVALEHGRRRARVAVVVHAVQERGEGGRACEFGEQRVHGERGSGAGETCLRALVVICVGVCVVSADDGRRAAAAMVRTGRGQSAWQCLGA